ncbi:Eukaryotic aspartyl protease family protein [Striga hermonthica]|uniref:Eukaryotic aspartyl protease family protein n=1 Tax=Striga hermonthica TaxID=68872 RepID=A0A9N7RK87_STRHE|nr:Eukaryotic aspartyl protease family protein [Striga hermonthica]
MATSQHSILPSIKSLLDLCLLLIIILVSCSSAGESRSIVTNFQTINTTSHSDVESSRSKTVVQVFHRDGPRGELQRKSGEAHHIPGRSGSWGEFMVTMGLGTPETKVTLYISIDIDLSFLQCQPCQPCRPQHGTIFDPKKSTSYSAIPYNSSQCSMLSTEYQTISSPTGTCIYNSTYNKGSLSKDKLTIAPWQTFADVVFGCSQFTRVGGLEAGILSLGRGNNISFVHQTATTYAGRFSLCLPSTGSSDGYLAFGKDTAHDNLTKFTPLITNTDHPANYFVDIISIAVGGRNLNICPTVFGQSGNTKITSDNTYTHLQPEAYKALSLEFKRQMKYHGYRVAPAFHGSEAILDTCFLTTGHGNITAPTVSFTFRGNVKVDLDVTRTLYAINSDQSCLTFVANTDPTDYAIFGTTQQRTFEVVFDVGREKVGIRPNSCT